MTRLRLSADHAKLSASEDHAAGKESYLGEVFVLGEEHRAVHLPGHGKRFQRHGLMHFNLILAGGHTPTAWVN